MRTLTLLLILSLFICYVIFASDEKKEEKADESTQKVAVTQAGNQTICPITGKKVDPKFSVDYQGGRIKFCSADCEAKFLKDPEAGFKKLEAAKETVDSIQTECTVSGDMLEGFTKILEIPGRKIYFCCNGCIDDFKQDQKKFLAKLPGVTVKDGVKVKPEEKK